MKQYKLIKEYPASDSLGTIITGSKETMYSKGLGFRNYDWAHVETHPEYWEEVIKKDYEVLIAKVVPYTILSIKRLSDGEVFAVGDLIKTPYTDCTPIIGFSTKYSTEYFIEVSTGFTRLLNLEKVKKQPIFLTHDGKNIFPEDTVWYVNKENLYYDYAIVISQTSFNSNTHAYFLTRQEAQDYINRNKVLFTTEDGVDIKKGDKYYFVDTNLKISLAPNASAGAGLYDERKYFSTYETALYYVIVNAKVLSIEEFWGFVSKPGSNVVKQKALKRLVKERLNLK